MQLATDSRQMELQADAQMKVTCQPLNTSLINVKAFEVDRLRTLLAEAHTSSRKAQLEADRLEKKLQVFYGVKVLVIQ